MISFGKNHLVAKLVADLRHGVSLTRLDRYRPPGGSDLDMVVNYFWNISLSEAFYPGLAALEVTLRSNVHAAPSDREGTDMWFRRLLEPGQLRDYAAAMLALLNRGHSQPVSGQIVPELTFGFWTTLLSQPYHQTLWAPQNTSLVKAVFPHLPRLPNNRHYIHQRYNDLRILRNRIMHHEPIWSGVKLPQKRVLPLNDLHDQLLEAIGWISPAVETSIRSIDRFDLVYANRAQLEASLKSSHGIP